MKKIALLLTFIIFFSVSNAQDSLKIMTFNCEFMWDGIEPEEGRINFDRKGNPEMATEHMKNLAEVIRKHNPDVVNLVETEGLNAVNMLNDKFLKDLGFKVYFQQGMDTYTGQDVAMLSKIDMYNFGRYDEIPYCGTTSKKVSKNYYAMTEIYGHKMAFISLHFLSRPTDAERVSKRSAQMKTIKQLAMSLDDIGYNLVLFGDFNDFDGDEECLDINSNEPKSKVLWELKMLDGFDKQDDLINVASKVKQEERYTAHYDKNDDGVLQFPDEVSAIDHILISKKLESNIVYVEYDHTHDPTKVTDHFPIITTLVF